MSIKIKKFIEKLKRGGIWIEYTPELAACETSPLDNSLLSVLKKKIQGKMFKTYEDKFKGVQKALDEISESTVRNFWKHCKLPRNRRFNERALQNEMGNFEQVDRNQNEMGNSEQVDRNQNREDMEIDFDF